MSVSYFISLKSIAKVIQPLTSSIICTILTTFRKWSFICWELRIWVNNSYHCSRELINYSLKAVNSIGWDDCGLYGQICAAYEEKYVNDVCI